MRKYMPQPSLWYGIKVAILFLVYVITAKAGLAIFNVDHAISLFWLPTGISLAVLILYGYDMWPGVTLGSFVAMIASGMSPGVAVGIAIGNTLEAIIGTYVLRRYIILFRCFERLEDTIGFIGLGVLCSSVISATVGTLSLYMGNIITSADISSVWIVWWIANSLSTLVITPFLLTSLAPSRPWNADRLSAKEIITFTTVLILSNIVIFWHWPLGSLPLYYLISLPLLWGGLRLGSRGITISIFITWFIATLGTIYGHGPFSGKPFVDALLYLEIFLGTLAITFLVFLSIVKERKHAAQGLKEHIGKLEQALQQISQADQAKNDFLAMLAHELRNPLAPLRSSLELMKLKADDNPDVHKLTAAMDSHVKTMARLLDDLLDISRITRKKIVLEKEIVDLRQIIDQSLEMSDPHIRKHRHQLTVTIPRYPVWVHGDPVRLEQMIVNVLNNAAKYTDPGGQINVTCYADASHVHTSIRDNGMGIEPTMLARIFEPFLQIDSKRSSTTGGLGVGLSLTYNLAELHNGKVEARSEGIGKGSEFIISLPLTEPPVDKMFEHESRQESKKPFVSATTKKYTVLVVDDNEAAATGLAELLRYKGHTVGLAYDGFSAIDTVEKFSPEIIIVDIGMPVMDGYEVARKLRQSNADLTLIALTGYGQEEDKIKAHKAGFDFHLTKPISIADVEKVFNEIPEHKLT